MQREKTRTNVRRDFDLKTIDVQMEEYSDT